MDLQAAAEALIQLISNITFLPVAVGFVLIATSLTKKLIGTKPDGSYKVHPGAIAFGWQCVAWAAWIFSKKYLGADDALFQTWIEAITTVMTGIASIVFGAGATEQTYQWFEKKGVPLIGNGKPHVTSTPVEKSATAQAAATTLSAVDLARLEAQFERRLNERLAELREQVLLGPEPREAADRNHVVTPRRITPEADDFDDNWKPASSTPKIPPAPPTAGLN